MCKLAYCQLIIQGTPEEVKLIMIDPKVVELSGFNGIPHLMVPVVTDPKKGGRRLAVGFGGDVATL